MFHVIVGVSYSVQTHITFRTELNVFDDAIEVTTFDISANRCMEKTVLLLQRYKQVLPTSCGSWHRSDSAEPSQSFIGEAAMDGTAYWSAGHEAEFGVDGHHVDSV